MFSWFNNFYNNAELDINYSFKKVIEKDNNNYFKIIYDINANDNFEIITTFTIISNKFLVEMKIDNSNYENFKRFINSIQWDKNNNIDFSTNKYIFVLEYVKLGYKDYNQNKAYSTFLRFNYECNRENIKNNCNIIHLNEEEFELLNNAIMGYIDDYQIQYNKIQEYKLSQIQKNNTIPWWSFISYIYN